MSRASEYPETGRSVQILIEPIRCRDGLLEHLEAWRSLAPTPMQSPEWMLAWWDAFATPNAELHILLARNENGATVGIAPLYKRGSFSMGSALRYLGSGHACSDFQSILARPGFEAVVAESICDWLYHSGKDHQWGVLELEGASQACSTTTRVLETFRRSSCVIDTQTIEHTWRLDLTGGLGGVLERLSKTQRKQSRNLLNRFDKHNHLHLSVLDGNSGDMVVGLRELTDLHQRRWQAQGLPGCFADDRFGRFLQSAMQNNNPRCKFRFISLREAEQALATQLFLCDGAKWYLYQTGRLPELDHLRIGATLNLLSIRAATELGAEFIDYLRGDEIYKGRLGAVSSECLRHRIVAPSWVPQLRHQVWSLGRELKNCLCVGAS